VYSEIKQPFFDYIYVRFFFRENIQK
jgi:hypothetical protein